jgi:MYXO-CTERM domain-containing protein
MNIKRRAAVAALVIAGVFAPRAAHAYILKHATDGALVSWRQAAVGYSVHPKVEAIADSDDAIEDAIASWSEENGAPKLALRSVKAPDAPGNDGVNGIFIGEAGNALAITVLTFDDVSGQILDADVIVDKDRSFFASDDGEKDEDKGKSGAYDLRKVLAHEIGHSLGLGDEPGHDDALMFPVIRKKEGRVTPGKDDLAGIEALYRSAPSSATTTMSGKLDPAGAHDSPASDAGGCAVTGARTSAGTTLPWAVLGLATLSLARRRRCLGRGPRPGQRS